MLESPVKIRICNPCFQFLKRQDSASTNIKKVEPIKKHDSTASLSTPKKNSEKKTDNDEIEIFEVI